jgi:hypothetical protein
MGGVLTIDHTLGSRLVIPLTAHHLLNICLPYEHNPLDESFQISGQEILDKSKADWLIKALATFQIFCLLASVIARMVRDFPVSQLEICPAAFSALAIFTYAANWA